VPDILFPNLTKLHLESHHGDIFVNNFQQILKNMENLEIVEMEPYEPSDTFFQYIRTNYSKHCIHATFEWYDFEGYDHNIADHLPIKILDSCWDLEEQLNDKRYNSQLQFLHLQNIWKYHSDYDANVFQDILDQCSNLKAIAFSNHKKENEDFSKCSEKNRENWQERITYLQSRGIEILHKDEIFQNETLQLKLAQEAGIKWRFSFT